MYRLYSLLLILFASSSLAGPKVLLLNSSDPQYPWTKANNSGIEHVLSSVVDTEDVYIEYMDSRRFIDNEVYLQALVNLYRAKYQQLKPDIIISTGDFALKFLIQYRADIFPTTPVVYNGINFIAAEQLIDLKGFVGIQAGEAIAENLNLITQLHKEELNEIIILSDQSALGHLLSKKVFAIKKDWHHPSIKLTLKDSFTFEELLFDVNNIEVGKALFILALHKDKHGRDLYYRHIIPTLNRYSKVPIYGMWGEPLMGLGILGGYMNDPLRHGKNTAEIVLDILSGTDIDSIKRDIKPEFLLKFDHRQLEKFNFDMKSLPIESEILFNKKTFFSRSKNQVFIISSIILSLIIIIIILSAQARRRQLVENKLAYLNDDLEHKIQQRTVALESSNQALLKLNSRMETLANTDDLTQIPNRRHGHHILEQLNYIEGGEYCIALFDIDYFKNVNDTYGHDIGDQALQFISHTISQSIRPSDTICRWGGEEFLLIMPATTIDRALTSCDRIRSLVASTPIPPIECISISAGVSSKAQAGTISELLRQADIALYQAKEQGRNRCIIWHPDIDGISSKRGE